MEKTDYPIDKKQWQPSLISGPVVLISTYNARKEPNVAPKSWLQMVSFEPPMLMFSGTKGNTTERNIIESHCFAVNLVNSSMASRVYGCINWFGQERIEKAGFNVIEASHVCAPLVAECKAHLECRLHSTIEVGSGFIIFGEIVAASIWEQVLRVEPEERYRWLDPILFLEDGLFASITDVTRVRQQ